MTQRHDSDDAEPKGDWLQTYSGRRFYPADPRPEDVSIVDIAHGLAHICRFGGQSMQFYSVAEHSVFVSELLTYRGFPWEVAMLGLLHDAHEAYTGDMIRPITRSVDLGDYGAMCDRIQGVITGAFQKLISEPHGAVKAADLDMLAWEARTFMRHPMCSTWAGVPAIPEDMPQWIKYRSGALTPGQANIRFLERFYECCQMMGRRHEG